MAAAQDMIGIHFSTGGSTVAAPGGKGQGIDLRWLREINRFAVKPDLAIYLDVPAETGMSRIRRKKSVLEKLELQRHVRDEYLKLVQRGELTLVDSTQPTAKVGENILDLVTRKLRELEI